MPKINTGGPALGCPDPSDHNRQHRADNMSLRAFAAIHCGGLEADVTLAFATVFNSDTHPNQGDSLAWAKWRAKANARFRCIHADALIAALGEGQ